jgi:enoyl-CoA hydratase/carnithine racemase
MPLSIGLNAAGIDSNGHHHMLCTGADMTIRAVLRHGVIQPVEPLPSDWAEGQELVVEEPNATHADAELSQWAQEMDAATAQIPAEEHDRFLRALDEIERDSKEAVRKQWGLP